MKKVICGIVIVLLIIGGVIFINKKLNTEVNDDYKIKENNNTKDGNLSNSSDEIIGRWDSVWAVNSEDATKTDNLRDVFGSSYLQYGSYLELNEDGTFIDRIVPITNGNKSNTGTYKIHRNYNKQGDCYIFLTYDDGSEGKLEKVILDDSNVSYLVLENFVNDYQITLKKA